jgi:hypothetical protein
MINAGKKEIIRWFNSGRKFNKKYMIIASAGNASNIYPIFVSEEEFEAKYDNLNLNPNLAIMEVYNLTFDMMAQIDNPKRVLNYPEIINEKLLPWEPQVG